MSGYTYKALDIPEHYKVIELGFTEYLVEAQLMKPTPVGRTRAAELVELWEP